MITENKCCREKQISHKLHKSIYWFQQALKWVGIFFRLFTGTFCLSHQKIISVSVSSLVKVKCTKCCGYFIPCASTHIQGVGLHFGIQPMFIVSHALMFILFIIFPHNGRFQTSQPTATSLPRVNRTQAGIWNWASARRQIVQKMENTSISICYNHHVAIKKSCLLKPLAPR